MKDEETSNMAGEQLEDSIDNNLKAILKVIAVPIPIVSGLGYAFVSKQTEIDFYGIKFSTKTATVILIFILAGLFLYCARCLRILIILLGSSANKAQLTFKIQNHPSIFNPYLKSMGKLSGVFDYSGVFALSAFFAISFEIAGRMIDPDYPAVWGRPVEKMRAIWEFITNRPEILVLYIFQLLSWLVFIRYLHKSWELINSSDKGRRSLLFFLTFILGALSISFVPR